MEAIVAAATTASSTPIALTTDEIKRAIVNPYAKANQNRKRRPPQDTPNDSRKKPCKQQLLAWNAAGAYDTDQHPSETSVAVVRLDGVRSTRNDGADTNSRKCNSFSPTESTIQTTKQSRNTHATAAVKRTGPTSSTRKKKGAVPGNERKANVKIQGPPPQLPFKSTSSSYSLGHLRVRDGIDFGWQGDVVGWNERLGRVYFNGFKLQNKLCSGCFKQGDTVQMKTKHVSASTYIIVAVFQATKSFLGDCYGNGDQHEIQKRGTCSM